jgi:oxygen-dependent protoporphyrinogen oxidase
VYDLEKKGGSIIGGVIKILQEKKLNPPPPPRNPALPPKPKGQTVGSFRRGLRTLPDAMAAKLGGAVRTSWQLTELSKDGDLYRLAYDTPQGRKELRARSVALTVPAYVAGDLLQQQCPSAAAALKVRGGCSRRQLPVQQQGVQEGVIASHGILHTFEAFLHTLRICF